MLPLLLLLLVAAQASAASLQTGGQRRRQLLEAHLQGPVPQPQPLSLHPLRSFRSLQQANVTSAQSLAAQDSPLPSKRPLKMAFYNKLDDSRPKLEQDYIMKKLIPATAAVLARSMRVREPTGPLPLAGLKDEAGLVIPAPPKGSASGAAPEGYDADILMKVTSMPPSSPKCEGLLAGAAAHLLENTSRRPVFGYVVFCHVDPSDFDGDLSTAVHEIMHALAMDPALFESFAGYNGRSEVLRIFEDGRSIIKTPQVVHQAKAHLGCDNLLGAELEDDGAQGSAGSHWEQRLFEGEMMDSVTAWGDAHHTRHVLTDLTLALLQDSGWYDVKYGSAGFNSYGYKAGCEFALGTYAEAMAVPSAAQYLCPEAMDRRYMCLHDHSGDGACYNDGKWDGFFSALPSTEESVDCQVLQGERGLRCLKRKADQWPECVPMTCSDGGKVLVDGKPCNPKTMECPSDTAMCEEPGYLMCTGALNDCTGRGDCFRGHCYCHTGWGGEDCSQPLCIGQCADGSSCPPSGFCGVPDCGSWSSGSDDRGIACFSALDSTIPHSMTPEREAPRSSLRPTVVAPIGVILPSTSEPAPVPAPMPAPAPVPVPAPAPAPNPAPAAAPPAAPPSVAPGNATLAVATPAPAAAPPAPALADSATTDEAEPAPKTPAPQTDGDGRAGTRGFSAGVEEEADAEPEPEGPPAASVEDQVAVDQAVAREDELPAAESGAAAEAAAVDSAAARVLCVLRPFAVAVIAVACVWP